MFIKSLRAFRRAKRKCMCSKLPSMCKPKLEMAKCVRCACGRSLIFLKHPLTIV